MNMRRNRNEETAFKRGVGGCYGGLLGWVRKHISKIKLEYKRRKTGKYLRRVFCSHNSLGGELDNYYIVYAKDTKVKYFIERTGYQFGITPLYNADGTLQIYEESEN